MTDPGPAAEVGTVVGLHRKPEVPGERGLPKRPVDALRVELGGVEGDFNRWRQEERTGDPAMALLLLPVETIEALGRDGWPVRPGDLGENVTTRGLRYDAMAPPHRFRFGSVVAEVSKACDPCSNLYGLPYVGAARGPDFLRATLGRRGWYARVLQAGTVRVGDPIRRISGAGGEPVGELPLGRSV